MSRLNEILDNHEDLNQLFSIVRHYGVNAEFIAHSLMESFQKTAEEKDKDASEEEKAQADMILADLGQFVARF